MMPSRPVLSLSLLAGALLILLQSAGSVSADAESVRPPVSAQRPKSSSPQDRPANSKGTVDGADEFRAKDGEPAKIPETSAVGEMPEWLNDPFRHLASDMADAAADLGKAETHKPATEIQPRVLSRLDLLVDMLEKAAKRGGGGAGGNPIRPAGSSTLGGGPGGMGPLRNPGQNRRDWASLSPKERELILQAQSQGFPPGYEDLLAEYFRRLAGGETPAEAQGEKRDRLPEEGEPSTGADNQTIDKENR